MTKKLGGKKFLFKNIKNAKSAELKVQIDELVEKIFHQANRFGFDMENETVTRRLIEVGNSDMDDHAQDSNPEAAYIERFLAIAYIQSLITLNPDSNDDETIAALCLGNWLVGILGGMSKNDHDSFICPACITKNYASDSARAKADKRFAPYRKAEAFVKKAWSEEKQNYNNNKSDFVRTYVKIVANKFNDAKGSPLKITEKQMREVWLKDSPHAS